jgi:hypothetical protein
MEKWSLPFQVGIGNPLISAASRIALLMAGIAFSASETLSHLSTLT